MAAATGDDGGTLGHGVSHMGFHLGNGRVVNHRALGDAGLKAVAHLDAAGFLGQLGDKLIVDAALHVEAVGADAGLAGVAVFADHRAFDGAVQAKEKETLRG